VKAESKEGKECTRPKGN